MNLFSRNAESVINEARKLMERSLAKMTGEIDKYKKKSGNKVGALQFISPQHHFNFNQLSRKFAGVSLPAIVLCF